MKTELTYLGTYNITPNSVLLSVECYGIIEREQKQTLEQQGVIKWVSLEKVTVNYIDNAPENDIDITDYLSLDILDELQNKINHPDN